MYVPYQEQMIPPTARSIFVILYNVCIVHSCCYATGQVYLLTSLCFTGSI